MLSLSHFRLDGPKKRLSFSLTPGVHCIPWFAPAGYGTIQMENNGIKISCLEGSLAFAELFCGNGGKLTAISVNQQNVPFSCSEDGTIRTEVSLQCGDGLLLHFQNA